MAYKITNRRANGIRFVFKPSGINSGFKLCCKGIWQV